MVINKKAAGKIAGAESALIGLTMLLPLAISLANGEAESAKSFALCAAPLILFGILAFKLIPKSDNSVLRMRDGFFIVGFSWILISVFGALPFIISGTIPNFADAFFETASGFSTTGSTIIADVECLPKGILFWRSFTHWLGGMGVLVLTIAILPMLGIGGQKIMRAETTGPTMDKISFTINDSARMLYTIYTGMTLLEIILLKLGGMSLFDAAIHTFGTVGTGGLSSYNSSIGAFNSCYAEIVIALFMLASGVNFNLYYSLLKGKSSILFKDAEFRTYCTIVASSTLFIAWMLLRGDFYENIAQSLRYAFFQVSSIITTTGYSTADFDIWPLPCKMVLFFLMLCGGCASSTGGGIKVIRVMIIAKLVRRGIQRKRHPSGLSPIKIGDKPMAADAISGVTGFVILYCVIVLVSTLLISLEGVGLTTSLTSVIACLSNIGPGFDLVGPTCNFAFYSGWAKMYLAMLMIAGRLELFTIVILFTKNFWDKKR